MSDEVNMKMLAHQLNISVATVSRALNDSYEISAKTKDRVCSLAKALNYNPNPAASNLRSNKTKTIAVIIPCVANNFFSLAIKGIEEVARRNGHHVLIYQTHEDIKMEMSFLNSLLSGRVDGILTSVSSDGNNNEFYENLVRKIPLVFFDRVYENVEGFKVTTDDYDISYLATEHLIEQGCSKIAYLYGLENLPAGKARYAGYRNAMHAHGLGFNPDSVITYDAEEWINIRQINELLEWYRPDALFSSMEEFIVPAYKACKHANLRIPEDIKILSFSNLACAQILNPSLTTITQPAFEMGKEATECLFKILNKKEADENHDIVLKSILIKSQSTGCL